jgi:hypothetical protein
MMLRAVEHRGSKVLAIPKGGYAIPPIPLYPYTDGMK